MCGRFALTTPEQLAVHFHLREEGFHFEPRHNIAPTQKVPLVTETLRHPRRELVTMRWGLIPHWAKDMKIGYKLINARAETVAEKPTFSKSFKIRRCLIPANGFYEWSHQGRVKQPYLVRMKNFGLFAMAGLWELWEGPGGEFIHSCTIITTESNTIVGKIHDRMPVIIKPDQYGFWLETNTDIEIVKSLLKPFDPFKMTAYPVSGMVNNPKNEGPGCIKRIDLM